MMFSAGTGIVIGVIAFMILAAVWEGFVLSVLWGWFVTPIFNLRPLSIPEAIAVALVIAMLTKQYIPPKKDDNGIWLYATMKPATMLFAGWITRQFI